MEEDALRVLTGPTSATPRMVDWEGTRYRVDLPRAEAVRLTKSQGQASRPYLSSALAVMAIAESLAEQGLTRETLRQQSDAFEHIWQQEPNAGVDEPSSDGSSNQREISAALKRAARSDDLSRGRATRSVAARVRGRPDRARAARMGVRSGAGTSRRDLHQCAGCREPPRLRTSFRAGRALGCLAFPCRRYRLHAALAGCRLAAGARRDARGLFADAAVVETPAAQTHGERSRSACLLSTPSRSCGRRRCRIETGMPSRRRFETAARG